MTAYRYMVRKGKVDGKVPPKFWYSKSGYSWTGNPGLVALYLATQGLAILKLGTFGLGATILGIFKAG